MCHRSDIRPGAYLVDKTSRKMYEVTADEDRVTNLVDVASPADDPKRVQFLTANAVNRFELVRPAPSLEDIASVAEWGQLG